MVSCAVALASTYLLHETSHELTISGNPAAVIMVKPLMIGEVAEDCDNAAVMLPVITMIEGPATATAKVPAKAPAPAPAMATAPAPAPLTAPYKAPSLTKASATTLTPTLPLALAKAKAKTSNPTMTSTPTMAMAMAMATTPVTALSEKLILSKPSKKK